MSFGELGLSDGVLRAISDAGYTEPTPIQIQAIPVVFMGRDILGCAQTGTGKTAGFTLPMIDILAAGRAKARMPRSLILEPTRELAAQVAESFETYGKYHKLTKALLIGGHTLNEQIKIVIMIDISKISSHPCFRFTIRINSDSRNKRIINKSAIALIQPKLVVHFIICNKNI